MKKLLAIITLGTFSALSADCYQGGCQGNPYYQQNRGYYQQDQRGYQQPGSYQGGHRYYQQVSPGYQQNQYDQNNEQNQGQSSDQNISSKVNNEIRGNKLQGNVSFDVNDGVVTLKGKVSNDDLKQKIENRVNQIKGVKKVNNQIQVKQQS